MPHRDGKPVSGVVKGFRHSVPYLKFVRESNTSMRSNRKLFYVLLAASAIPVVIFRIMDWMAGRIETVPELIGSLGINLAISVIVTLTIAYVILYILEKLNERLPWNENLLKRLLAEVVCTFPVAAILGVVFGLVVFEINPTEGQTRSEFVFTFVLISVIMNFVLVAVSDWFYFFDRWKSTLVEQERAVMKNALLEKEAIEARYDALRNQVNPHFLFNSLNVLSSLIQTDAHKAEEFVDEFAVLYRYILEETETPEIELAKEIHIARSYAFLQKQRFGDAVHFMFDASIDEYLNHLVFPLSIQTLLENAVKHNRAERNSPLNVKIYARDTCLLVTNNLQPKSSGTSSTGLGLVNLKSRYAHFDLEPTFEKRDHMFVASLPLIAPSVTPVMTNRTNEKQAWD